ncbi:MAG: DNA-binding NarL/FixJ family response regulator [Acidimicrobiales bacterium]|jgi:DNA-binding NarL/FixJ family response regulator
MKDVRWRTNIILVEASPIRVILCESRRVIGEALGEHLTRTEGLYCLGIAKSYFAARRALAGVSADVVLVGLNFHEEEVRSLIGECAPGRVVFLANQVTQSMVALQAEYPTFTVVSAAASLADLVENLRGEPGVDLLGDAVPTGHLSPRESQTLSLLVQGMSPTDISEHLYVSIHTVRFHIRALLAKLDVSSQAAAIVAGIEQGLVSPPALTSHVHAGVA